MENDIEALAKEVLKEGRKTNLFSSSITVEDVKRVLDLCLVEDQERFSVFHLR